MDNLPGYNFCENCNIEKKKSRKFYHQTKTFNKINCSLARTLLIFVCLFVEVKGFGEGDGGSGWNKESSDHRLFDPQESDTCADDGLQYPGYSLVGGTKAGKYIDLGRIDYFDDCIDLCCKDPGCKIAIMLTYHSKQKCFRVDCYSQGDGDDSDTCQPKRGLSRYDPYLFIKRKPKAKLTPESSKTGEEDGKKSSLSSSQSGKAACHAYSGDVCSGHIDPTKLYYYADGNGTELDDRLRGPFDSIKSKLSGSCRKIALQAICYRFYPHCPDPATPSQVHICESECKKVTYGECSAEFTSSNMLAYLQRIIPNCDADSAVMSAVDSQDCVHLQKEGFIQPVTSTVLTSSTSLNATALNTTTMPLMTSTTQVEDIFATSSPVLNTTTTTTTTTTTSSDIPNTLSTTQMKPEKPTIVNSTDEEVNLEEALSTSHPETTTTTIAPVFTTPAIKELRVSAGDNTEITLPEDSVDLYASAWPKEQPGEESYLYKWGQVLGPAESHGYIEGKTTKNAKLTKLDVPGLYTFKLEVTSSDSKKHGVGYVNITVNAPKRLNHPPRADVYPKDQTITLPTNTVILDGSKSTDDVGITSYKWEELKGPIKEKTVFGSATDNKILQLKNLVAGLYVFKLTVTDKEGATDSVETTVTVLKEKNYPPKANAGHDVIIRLPNNSVTLNGSLSSDDKGNLDFEWKKTPDSPTSDLQGSDKPVLHVSSMTAGTYVFVLKVTDAQGLTDETSVKVIVLPEHNTKPVAVAGDNLELVYPDDSTTLDGSKSTDNSKIVSYHWQITSGPSKAKLVGEDKAKVHVTDLRPGTYMVKLTVTDDKHLQGSDFVKIHVKKDHNEAPVANAGEDVTIYLPTRSVVLDGRKSSDDELINTYRWTRAGLSPAAGDVLNHTDRTAVLHLANLVKGRYVFDLTVTDNKGRSSKDSATIVVNEDKKKMSLVELYLDLDVNTFTEENKKQLLRKISVVLEVGKDDIQVEHLENVDYGVKLTFYVCQPKLSRNFDGKYVADMLKQKVGLGGKVFDFKMLKIEPYICRNNCSSHGYCSKATKLCVCDSFWMSNVFKAHFGERETNCDWSVLYVSVAAFGLFLFFFLIAWAVCFLFARRRRSKRRTRYRALRTHDPDTKDEIMLIPKGKYSAQSLTFTETDDDSEEETTVFDKKRLVNGNSRPNGSVPNGKKRDHAM